MARKPAKQKTNAEIKAIYDSFDNKDMSLNEFVKQFRDLSDPKKIMSDLGDLELRKARERLNKIRTDQTLSRN